MSKRIRIPPSVWAELDIEIKSASAILDAQDEAQAAEARLRGEDGNKRGVTNADVAELVLEPAKAIFTDFVTETVADVIARRISVVLGGAMDASLGQAEQAFLPNLELPSHFSVPQDDHSAARWKRKEDCTPNELFRVVERRREFENGIMTETNKIELMYETAVRLGCDLDMPISSVMDKKDRPSPKSRREHSHLRA